MYKRQAHGRAQQGGGAAGEAGEAEAVMLYRGVRGELPDSFFEPDAQGFLTAVDFGFQSTSADREVTIGFMAPGAPNVLWVMHGSHGADSAEQLHNGAVLQALSQFPAEAETAAAAVHAAGAARGRRRGHDGRVPHRGQGGAEREGRGGAVQGDPRAPVLRLNQLR